MKKLLVEVYKGSSLHVAESQSQPIDGMMRMQGVFAVVDSVNRNERFYPKGDYVKHIQRLSERIEKFNDVLGELEHPQSMTVDYNNVSHKIEKVWLDESTGEIMGQLLLLDTPKGKIAQSIAKSGTPLHISSRAMGTVSEKGAVTLEELVTYDLVGTPGFEQASLTKLHESHDRSGKVVAESYAYDVDDRGNVIENAEVYNVVEKRILGQIDQKINEALKKSGSVSKEDIMEHVKEYVNVTAAPKIQRYLKRELSEKINAISSSEVMTKQDVVKLMDESFVRRYAPIIEKWVTSEYTPVIEKWLNTEYASIIEKWAIHEFAPVIEKWTTKEFAPVVEKWVTGEFAPVVEKWAKTEFAGEQAEVIEKWISNSFAPVVQKWIINEYSPTLEAWMKNTQTSPRAKKVHESKSKVIDRLDNMIKEAKDKPKTATVNETLEQRKKREINENFVSGPAWLRNIPDNLKLSYVALSEQSKSKIARQAAVRTFSTIEEVHRFWRTRDFSSLVENKGVQKRQETVNENVSKLSPRQQQLVNLTRNLRQ